MFTLFNLQGTLKAFRALHTVSTSSGLTPLPKQLVYYSNLNPICQELFSSFSNLFSVGSFKRRSPQALAYNTRVFAVCQHLFSSFFIYFSSFSKLLQIVYPPCVYPHYLVVFRHYIQFQPPILCNPSEFGCETGVLPPTRQAWIFYYYNSIPKPFSHGFVPRDVILL